MRLTQERIISILDIAIKYQTNVLEIRKRIIPELDHLIASNKTLRTELENLKLFIIQLTELDMEAFITLANERAHFNPTRIKHNKYMRSIQQRSKMRKKLINNPLDLPIEEEIKETKPPRQNLRQNNVADVAEVPLLANIEAEEKRLGLNSDTDELKQKFGSDFHLLPARVGLKRH